MDPAGGLHDAVVASSGPADQWVSVAGLQCRLREIFASKPAHRALALALQETSELLGADYAVVHARYGSMPLTEEWRRDGFELGDVLRETVTDTMAAAIAADHARCLRLHCGGGDGAVVAAVLYDDGHEPAGSAAFLVRDCTRATAYELLVQVEALVGFVAVLLSSSWRSPGGAARVPQGPPTAHIGEPSRVLLDMAAEIGNRHGLDQVAIGIVDGRRVRVALMNGEAEPRAANPGVRLLSEAMGECLDRNGAVLVAGDPGVGEFRLHAAWLHSRGGGAVGSLPMVADDKTLAIVSVACADPAALSAEKLAAMGRDLLAYAPVLRVARLAARSLPEHAREALGGEWRKWRRGGWRRVLAATMAVAVLAWGALGKLPYSLTVPCVVKAAGRRSVSCPRDGILAEIFVRPGDSVRLGQLLAEFDSQDDQLARAELECEQKALAAQIDRALADHDAGQLRVLEAQRMGVLARLDVCEQRIEQARIRAPQEGLVLIGDLRERVGSRMAMGDELYQLACIDGAMVELRIPEQVVLDAREATTASFVASADPGTAHRLGDLRIAPASIVADGHNTFVGEARTDASLWRLSPGMEGFAMLDVGQRPVWWVLGHRVLSWLQLNFWI